MQILGLKIYFDDWINKIKNEKNCFLVALRIELGPPPSQSTPLTTNRK